MKKDMVLKAIDECRLAAVLRVDNAEDAVTVSNNLIAKGVRIIEVPFTVRGADKAIEHLAKMQEGTNVVIGAGTVLDAETARTAILAGAEFVVSPCVAVDVIKLCNRYSVAVFPGVNTPTEVYTALEYGADYLKLFPGNLNLLKSFKGPFPNVKWMVTGGVNLDNLDEWFKAGASSVGTSAVCDAKCNVDEWVRRTSSL